MVSHWKEDMPPSMEMVTSFKAQYLNQKDTWDKLIQTNWPFRYYMGSLEWNDMDKLDQNTIQCRHPEAKVLPYVDMWLARQEHWPIPDTFAVIMKISEWHNILLIYSTNVIHIGMMILDIKCDYHLLFINSLWPSVTKYRQRSGSTFARVMACCLTAPSHYLN